MFYVYFLKSLKNKDLYIGSTEDITNRVSRHNAGKVRSTQFYRPWELLGYESFETRSEAVRREMHLKTGQQKEILKRKFGLI
jgi:putative endonuclease